MRRVLLGGVLIGLGSAVSIILAAAWQSTVGVALGVFLVAEGLGLVFGGQAMTREPQGRSR